MRCEQLRGERRQSPRVPAEIECKLIRPDATRYMQARTADLSTTGALLVIEAGAPLYVGEQVLVALAWDGGALLEADALVSARVVRAGRYSMRLQPVALRFDDEQHRVRALARPTIAA